MKKALYILVTILFISCSSYKEQLDELFSNISTQTEFNGLVYVEKNNQIIYNNHIISDKVPTKILQQDSKIYLASLTKLFTEIVVLKLIEEGKLNLKNTISDYRTNFKPTYGKVLTIENLLNMSSGLPRELDSDNLMNSLKFDKNGFAGSFLDSIPNMELSFKPGSNYEYSNLNYWLLGGIIEKVSGLNLGQAFSKYIFQPLEMSNSGYSLNPTDKIIGYKKDKNQWVVDQTNYNIRYASGGAYSSMEDLIKLSKSLRNNTFLNEDSLRQLFGKNDLIEVYGSLPSFTNMIYINREENVSIVLLNNIGVPDLAKVSEMKEDVTNILGIKPPKATKSKNKITLLNVANLNDSIPAEKGMKDWAEAILEGNKTKMNSVFNAYAVPEGKMKLSDPTWDELIRIKKEWPNFRVYGYRWVEDQNPKGIELWLRCDGGQRIALQWVMENKEGKTMALFVKPDNMTWLGQEFK
ncbi:MAG: beta-lactamase family protein [Flavobacteriaceae bacterium]|nr:beta-lactamase family protein [Flavobacteriaceae bacterium]